jgi:hypothetical protein
MTRAPRCTNCQEPGHHRGECKNDPVQRLCTCGREIHHASRVCHVCRGKARRGRGRGYPPHKRCGYCGEKGHNILTCAMKKEGRR